MNTPFTFSQATRAALILGYRKATVLLQSLVFLDHPQLEQAYDSHSHAWAEPDPATAAAAMAARDVAWDYGVPLALLITPVLKVLKEEEKARATPERLTTERLVAQANVVRATPLEQRRGPVQCAQAEALRPSWPGQACIGRSPALPP